MRQLLYAVLAASLAIAATAQQDRSSPGTLLLPESALPAYESNLNHAAFIRGWNKASLERGEKIYQFVCHACHGDLNLPGSLPDARPFATGTFQHGSDPLRMYQTVTRGWRLMPPQVQLVPQEKYDVIHYIRETFLAPHNRGQLFTITEDYLAHLPAGTERGPAPRRREPWREMNYGQFLMGTFEVADAANRESAAGRPAAERDVVPPGANIAYKGIALRLDAGEGGVAAGREWVVFEHDTLRFAGGWTGEGFIDWDGINFNGRHVVRPRTIGTPLFELPDGPGWANPQTGDFVDQRVIGVDGRRFGPLPRNWCRFLGVYRHPERTVFSYLVGDVPVLDSCERESLGDSPVFVRTLNIGRSTRDLILRVAKIGPAVAVAGLPATALTVADGETRLRIPAAGTPLRLTLRMAPAGTRGRESEALSSAPPRDLTAFTHGGPAQWQQSVTTPIIASDSRGPFEWERLTLPQSNPWQARMRPSGIDFLPGGSAAVVCTWDGDVWRVDGIAGDGKTLAWRRMASGLFQPLGIKTRGNEVFVTCRDQLVVLRDLNGDGETDYYECFNSDHQVTEHFHEFAMGLQTDAAGNFYYAKSARHARTALVPQHGTLLKVSADGRETEILANGFRAANGVCLNDDGSFFVTDQEGHWMPMNRINRVVPGKFFGNMWSYGAPADESDAAMAAPVCWIDKAFDRSPGELVWVNSRPWGSLDGALLNLSYGRGRIEVVVREQSGDTLQGAVCVLPLPDFPTGIMRGRFHPASGDLYVCGLSAWASSQTLQEGGVYRIRRTITPALVPIGWHVRRDGVELKFSDALPAATPLDPGSYSVASWSLKRSASYGSPRINERQLPVARVKRLDDGCSLRLVIPQLAPVDIVEITCRWKDAEGLPFERVIQGTIHFVSD